MHKANEEFGTPEAVLLGYDNVLGPFIILATGFAGALVLSVMEKCLAEHFL